MTDSASELLAAHLDAAGFWGGSSDAERERLRGSVAAGASPFARSGGGPVARRRGRLGEGEVESLLGAMAPAHAKRGVNLAVETVEGPWDEASAGYKIRINGIEVDLYRFDPDEPDVPLADDPWIDCTLKPLAVVIPS